MCENNMKTKTILICDQQVNTCKKKRKNEKK
jgi:hypothetical protein